MIAIDVTTGDISLKKTAMKWYQAALANYPKPEDKEQLTALLVRVPKICNLTVNVEDRESNEYEELTKYLTENQMIKQQFIDGILADNNIEPHTNNLWELGVVQQLRNEGYIELSVDGKMLSISNIEMLDDGTIKISSGLVEGVAEVDGAE